MTTPNRFAGSLLVAMLPIGAILFAATEAGAAERPDIMPQLRSGELAAAEQSLRTHLSNQKDDDLARFQLGTVELLRAVEQLSQDGARYGALNRSMMLPFIRLGGFVAGSREPEPVTYDDVRAMVERFQASVDRAEATLAPIEDKQLSWKLDLQEVRLDLDGDGQAGAGESLGQLYRLAANRRQPRPSPAGFPVGFDSADVYWLRGYCHVLSAMADVTLAYDHQELFDRTAHVFFAKPQTEFANRRQPDQAATPRGRFRWQDITDAIAVIHLFDFELREPERLARAREHLLKMIEMSRLSWKLILTETDNDHEWIPGPNQQSVIERLTLNREQVDTWHRFLNEAEAVLEGQKLIPFWRDGFDEGVNLRRVFTEPRDFDLVLWVQGTAALPYLEEGTQTSPETWRQFQRVFGGQFIGIAFWIN